MAKKATNSRATAKRASSEGERWGGISSGAVEKATGRNWSAWCKALDKDKASKMSHKEIAALVGAKHGVGDWWCQMVTVGYEQAKGLRVKHQVADGFSASVSRTYPVSMKVAYAAVSDARQRTKWLKDELSVTTATPHKSVRIAWNDGTRVAIGFYDKTGKSGTPKTQIAFQHEKLKSADDVTRVKRMWASRLDALGRALGA